MRLNRYIRKFTTKKLKGKRKWITFRKGPFDQGKVKLSFACTSTLTFTVRGATGFYSGKYGEFVWNEA